MTSKTLLRWSLTVFVALLLAAGAAIADDASRSDNSPIPWDSLGVEEQRILKPLAGRWEELAPQRQQRLRKGARRWLRLGP